MHGFALHPPQKINEGAPQNTRIQCLVAVMTAAREGGAAFKKTELERVAASGGRSGNLKGYG